MSEESSVTTVEYQTMPERTLPVIASEILTIERQVQQTALVGAIEIGHRLQEAKEIAGHGEFGTWCTENLNYSQRKAERFMKLSAEYEAGNWLLTNSTISSKVSVFKALSLLALPEEDVETFVEEHNISEMSVRDIDEEVRRLKEEKSKAEASAEAWKKMKEETESALALNEEAMANLQNKVTQLSAELRIKELDQAPAIDQAEYEKKIEELNASIEKGKEKERKLKDQLKRLTESKQEDIDKAVADQREALYEQVKAEHSAEMERAAEINAELQTQLANLEKKLQNSNNESKMKFKLLVDELQSVYQECCLCISNEEEETAANMKSALKMVMTSMTEGL